MARSSLSKSRRNLNLSGHNSLWLQKAIEVGSGMAQALRKPRTAPEQHEVLATEWEQLLVELVKMIL